MQVQVAVVGGRGVLRFADVLALPQRAQDLVATRERGSRVVERVVVGRSLRKPGEQRRLLEREAARRHGEVRLGSGLDPIGVIAVVDVVEIRREDPALRPGPR